MSESTLPVLKTHVGQRGKLKDPDGTVRHYTIKDEALIPQSDNVKKVFCLQLLEFDENQRMEVRICYYIIGKKERMRGKWTWGQYAPLMPYDDFRAIIRAVEEKGWLKLPRQTPLLPESH